MKFAFLSLVFFFSIHIFGQNELKFSCNGVVKFDTLLLDDVTIDIKLENKIQKTIKTPKNGRFNVMLNFQNEYTLTFSKTGYQLKNVIVNTKVPTELLSEGFSPYSFNVGLGKKGSPEQKDLPMIFYDATIDNFSYKLIPKNK